MEFREFYNLIERAKPLGMISVTKRAKPLGMISVNPDGAAQSSLQPLGMVIPSGVFGALPSQWTGSEVGDDPLSSDGYMGTNWVNGKFDLMLPSISKTSQIRKIDNKINPIFVFLADGTKLYIPYDAFKKIKVEPQIGRNMTVIFQRRNDDRSILPSAIKSIQCN